MPRRSICPACERPRKTCLCDALLTLECAYRIIILQDPTEARHALSSAPLLAKSITNTQLIVGEAFEPDLLLGPGWQRKALLVYPTDQPVSSQSIRASDINTLIFLDGTWKKTSRLLHLNPWLQTLPRFSLKPDQASRYRIRKSPRADGLSTIEAAAHTLNALQSDCDFSAILGAFNKMIDFQIAAMGAATFQKNYPEK